MNEPSHEVKRAIEKIEVPEGKLDQAILTGIGKAKDQQKKPPRKLYPFFIAATAAVFLTAGSAFVSPAMARMLSSVPVFDSIFEFAGDLGLVIASERGLSQGIGQTVTDQGISLTIEDVYYDGTRLSLSYLQEGTEEKGRIDQLGELQLFVDGKEINFGDSRTGKQLAETQYAGVINIHTVESLPDSFELKIGVRYIDDVQGSWNFTIPVKKAKEAVMTISSGETVTYKDQIITVNDVKIGPAGTKLSLSISAPDASSLMMVDDHLLQFNLLDEQGNALTLLDAYGTGDDSKDGRHIIEMEYRYEPLSDDVKALTVSPYLMPVNTGAPVKIEQELLTDHLPLTVDQGEMGSIIVHSIRHEDDGMVLTFESDSEFPFDGYFQYNTIWLEDEAGNNLMSSKKALPERIRPNIYEQEFKKADGPLTLVTFEMHELKVLKEYEVSIPLR